MHFTAFVNFAQAVFLGPLFEIYSGKRVYKETRERSITGFHLGGLASCTFFGLEGVIEGGFGKDNPRVTSVWPCRSLLPQFTLGLNFLGIAFHYLNLMLRSSTLPMHYRAWVI